MRSIEEEETARYKPRKPPCDQVVIEHTRRWVSVVVIGLGLCPFARRVFEGGQIRYAVSHSRDKNGLLSDVVSELQRLLASAQIETTLLIHPQALRNFLAYNDFLGVVNEVLKERGLFGSIQVASFHPRYRFAGTEPNAVENYTNRSPYPMLHLLRESSVSQAVLACEDTRQIPRRNIETMRNLGQERILSLLQTVNAQQ